MLLRLFYFCITVAINNINEMRILLSTVALFISTLTFAQQGVNVSGKIINAETSAVIPHVFLNIGQQITVLSNHNGEFQFHNVPKGTLNMDITHIAFKTKKISLDIDKDTVLNIYLEPKSIVIDEVDVQKTSTTNGLKQVQRNESQGKNLAEVLSDIAGVSILKTGTTIAKPMINGLFGNRIILLNNGVRHESQQWGLDHAPEIDPFTQQKITILKNTEALRYGADALGGLVKMEQKEIIQNKILAGNIHMGANSNGRGGYINTQLEGTKNQLSYRAGITGIKSGNLKTPDYYIGNTGKTELNGNLLLEYHKEKQHFSIYFSQFGTELGIFQGAHVGTKDDILARIAWGRPFDHYNFSYNIASPKQKVSHQLAKLSYSYHLTENKIIESTYSLQRNHRREYDLRRVESDDTPMADIVLTTQQFEAIYKNLNSQIGISGSLQVNNNIAGTGTTPITPNFDNHNVAVFAGHKITYGDHYIDFGARYDYKYFDAAGYRYDYNNPNSDGSVSQYLLTDQRHFHNFSGILGHSLNIQPNLTWKSNLSLAWRAPSASELYSDGIHHGTGTYEIGDIKLKSEQGYKWSNSMAYTSSWLAFHADLYGQLIHNYIYSTPNPDSVRQTIRGTFPIFEYKQDNALFYGMDIQADIKLNPQLIYEFTFSSVRAKNTTQDSYLPYIPADRLNHSITYHFLEKENRNTYLKVKHHYQAKQNRYEPDSDFSSPPASYHTLDFIANTSWKFSNSKSINVLLSIENVLNKAYKDYLDRFRYYTHSIGRNTAIKINYTF